jgi:hypothetical protein
MRNPTPIILLVLAGAVALTLGAIHHHRYVHRWDNFDALSRQFDMAAATHDDDTMAFLLAAEARERARVESEW